MLMMLPYFLIHQLLLPKYHIHYKYKYYHLLQLVHNEVDYLHLFDYYN